MAHNIIPLIPQHTVYVEPFCGGATILFKKPWPKVSNTHHYREFINDKEGRLINFYSVLQDKVTGPELVAKLQVTPWSEELYYRATDIMRAPLEEFPALDRAWAYFVDSQQSFANIISAGWGRSVYAINQQATWCNKISRLPDYLARMASVGISCQDALENIKSLDSPQTFFYCDPPYVGTRCDPWKGYSLDDFRALICALDACKGSFILSSYPSDVDIPGDWERFYFSATCSVRGKSRGDREGAKDLSHIDSARTEVVYRRFNRVPVRQELQALYDKGLFDCFVARPKELPYPSE